MLSFRRFGSLRVSGTRAVHAGARLGAVQAWRPPRAAATLAALAMMACVADVSGLAVVRTEGDDSFETAKEKILSSLGSVGKDGANGEDEVERFIDAYGSYVGKFGFGGVMGLTSGYAMKKVGKLAALVVGIGFVGLQALTYGGYIKQIDWKKVEEKAVKALDVTGDGSFNKDDVKAWWRQFKKVMKQQLPTNSGFAGGFALGFYVG